MRASEPTNSTCLPLFTVVSQLPDPIPATHNTANVFHRKADNIIQTEGFFNQTYAEDFVLLKSCAVIFFFLYFLCGSIIPWCTSFLVVITNNLPLQQSLSLCFYFGSCAVSLQTLTHQFWQCTRLLATCAVVITKRRPCSCVAPSTPTLRHDSSGNEGACSLNRARTTEWTSTSRFTHRYTWTYAGHSLTARRAVMPFSLLSLFSLVFRRYKSGFIYQISNPSVSAEHVVSLRKTKNTNQMFNCEEWSGLYIYSNVRGSHRHVQINPE